MKNLLLFSVSLLFFACTSKLDKPELEPLLLDNSINPNLKISVAAFLEQPINRSFLDSSCIRSNKDNPYNFSYSKDSSFFEFQNDKLYNAVIKTKGQFLNYGIEIGQTRAAFRAIFHQLHNSSEQFYVSNKKDRIEISTKSSSYSTWVFHFENDLIKHIQYYQQ